MVDIAEQTFRSNITIQLANNAIKFLEKTPVHPLPPASNFPGPGVYMIYYRGNHQRYKNISNGTIPIYIGKAVPTGWRTGIISNPTESKLKSRLMEHARSIESVDNLELAHFVCRFAIIPPEDASIISVIESSLIQKLRPIWNTTIDGFGNHDPGRGRYQQAKSEWDTLHPGRTWAARLQG